MSATPDRAVTGIRIALATGGIRAVSYGRTAARATTGARV